ncbi:MAG TPA: 1,4-alpha-glucan branching protein GlgB [Steroidobacteraceae bacterium]|jgi:1,4-alpha-glucan branching enzyme|nr:1,4-alpha-glucan branching protein GlgB [Steroidobacteraceae bacterium]
MLNPIDDAIESTPAVDPALAGPAGLAQSLIRGELGDPFALLGLHASGNRCALRVFAPPAQEIAALDRQGRVLATLQPLSQPGLFAGWLPNDTPYVLRIRWPNGDVQETEDPYSFGLLLGELDVYLLAEGNHLELGRCLGAQQMTIDGVAGVRFAVWAPNARRVSVVGDFNSWDGRRHMMRKRVEAGVWELFVPRLSTGTIYKYEIVGPHGLLPLKADPVALQIETPPRTASVVSDPTPFKWSDAGWLQARTSNQSLLHGPLSIYEVHAGSWRRVAGEGGRALNWNELGDQLIPYVQSMGFTHIELMPIMGHPFSGSWGYQVLSQFAPQSTFGPPHEFARFIDRCHAVGIGVLLDWVPGHFPVDTHGLAHFDGTPLYEHSDPREGFHQEWNTAIYNLGRREVHSFLLSSALHWLEHFHVDGLRVDAVASLLYRDYARREGEWIPNQYGGRENLEAIDFLRHLNDAVTERFPGALVIAEESTAWPGVTQPTRDWGLGFTYKWNMGWMHDTLRYVKHDPVHRSYAHHDMTFGLLYAFSERFVLPLSHDEVVHGKGSLIGRMPGDAWQRFANLRAYFSFMWTQPGKKLLFMGGEFGQDWEWNHDGEIDWRSLEHPMHLGVQRLVADLNRLYRQEPALHVFDCDGAGFRWIAADDVQQSIYAYYRCGHEQTPPVIAVCNFTPVPRHRYRIGAPRAGRWREILNSDAEIYGGSNLGNGGWLETSTHPEHGQPFSLELTLPPLATVLLRYESQ